MEGLKLEGNEEERSPRLGVEEWFEKWSGGEGGEEECE